MKKIMFNDKYGLTDAVLQGRKTMTRRIVTDGTPLGNWEETVKKSRYRVGDVVAVAQSYSSFRPIIIHNDDYSPSHPGWNNKMFVRADLMPHRIRITDVRVERLQDISDDDCLKEGIEDCWAESGPNEYMAEEAKVAFAVLIIKMLGRKVWDSNPLVFVYSFELVK